MHSFIRSWTTTGLIILIHGAVWGQATNKPVNTIYPPAPTTAYTGPTNQSSTINFVRTKTVMEPLSDTEINGIVFGYEGPNFYQENKANISTDYFDGLGRKIETVDYRGIWASDQGYQSLVTRFAYDSFGREAYKYFPSEGSPLSGKFVPGIGVSPSYSMQHFFPGEQAFYSKTEYELSALNRVLKILPFGNSWAGSGRGTSYQYHVNTALDSVVIWDISHDDLTYANSDSLTNIPVAAGYYAAGQLKKNIAIDAMGNSTVEYIDKDNKIVLKKVQVDSTTSSDLSGYGGWLCTYYIYDEFDLLRFVISPKGVAAIKGTWTFSPIFISELCFRYEYDGRNRIIGKKVPGAGWTYMVYDKRDRLIFTQDANLRARNQWLTTLYDDINRPVTTGIISYSSTRQALQDYVDQQSFASSTVNVGSPIIPSLYVSDRITSVTAYKASQNISFTGEFESEAIAEFTAFIDSSQSTETVPVSGSPLPPNNNFIALTRTYYDNYGWNSGSDKQFSTDDISKLNNVNTGRYLDPVPSSPNLLITGLVTGGKVRILSDPNNLSAGNWLTTVNYYDEKDRVIQTHADNYKSGVDVTLNRYSFTNKLNVVYQRHMNPAASSQPLRIRSIRSYTYLDEQRDYQVQINDSGANKTIATFIYNYLKQPVKKLRPIGSEEYSYNPQGWLTGISNYYVNPSLPEVAYFKLPPSNLWFGEIISYDYGFEHNQYNGNIAGVTWLSRGDGQVRSYGFNYDRSNRLLAADFNQLADSSWTKSDPNNPNYSYDFSVKMGDGVNPFSAYDENGNIRSMKQWGLKLNTSSLIDDLAFNYTPGANKLLNVIDAANDTATKLGDFRTSGLHPVQNKANTTVDYTYDSNGNLLKDLNKDIGNSNVSGIEYNHLNLPYRITVYNRAGVKGTITYIYDAAGDKLEKKVSEAGQPDAWTSYIGPFQYQNDSLQFFVHDEGRVRVKRSIVNNQPKTDYIYDYFMKDHLGNIRMVLTEESQQDIYPAASLENPNDVALGSLYYNINNGNIVDKSSALAIPDYPNNNGIATNNTAANAGDNSQKIYRLNGSNNSTKMGLGITLKVMAGDSVSIFGKSYWKTATGTGVPGQPSSIALLDLLNAFVGSALPGTKKGPSGNDLNALPEITGALTTLLTGQGQTSTNPKAYINWILFDENFHPVTSSGNNSGFDPVGAEGVLKTHTQSTGEIKKSGYLFIYCSNESRVDVFFDNLQVVHSRGPLLEETHYYPFGLTMAGISSNALKQNDEENKRKYNGIEYENSFDLNIGETFFRTHDPQLGRWWQIDPKPTETFSPYSAMNNNPLLLSDPLGDTTWLYSQNGKNLGYVPDKLKNQIHFIQTEGDPEQQINTKGLSKKQLNTLGRAFRQISMAFMGSKTLSDMRKITEQSVNLKKEVGFVGMVGGDKEIRLTALPVDEGNKIDQTPLDRQINTIFRSAEEQSNVFLSGHTHIKAYVQGWSAGDGSPMSNLREFGNPSYPDDYANQLYRSKGATEKGRATALILTPFGTTVYGTEQSSNRGANNSYILYKSLK